MSLVATLTKIGADGLAIAARPEAAMLAIVVGLSLITIGLFGRRDLD